jgi:hypothetical protein
MWGLPRGMVIGNVDGDSRFSEAEHFWKANSAAAFSTCAISARCWTRRTRHVTGLVWMVISGILNE